MRSLKKIILTISALTMGALSDDTQLVNSFFLIPATAQTSATSTPAAASPATSPASPAAAPSSPATAGTGSPFANSDGKGIAGQLHTPIDKADWEALRKLDAADNPPAALVAVEQFLKRAIATNDAEAALVAILLKAKYTAMTDNYRTHDVVRLRILKQYFDAASPELRPLLAAAYARVFRNYYAANRFEILHTKRHRATANLEDVRTWDASLLREQIASLLDTALASAERLQKLSVKNFPEIFDIHYVHGRWRNVTTGTDDALAGAVNYTDARRPTLFDFVAHEALDFYAEPEGDDFGSNTSETARFQLTAASPALGTFGEFISWKPTFAGGASNAAGSAADPVLRTVAIYQSLMRFHQTTANDFAIAALDLERIQWAADKLGIFSDADETRPRIEAALTEHINRWKNVEPSAEAAAMLAGILAGAGTDTTDTTAALAAYRVASHGAGLYPASVGGKQCRAILDRLEQREFTEFTTESVWNEPVPEITVATKNLPAVYLRAVAANWEDFLSEERNRPHRLNDAEFARLRRATPVKEWTERLPKADFTRVRHSFPAPSDLKPGFYFILASAEPTFAGKANAIRYVPVWVSDLALLFGNDEARRNNAASTALTGFVLNAVTGEPVPNATVSAWPLEDNRKRARIADVTTDATGAFTFHFANRDGRDVLLLATTPDGRRVSNDSADRSFYSYRQTAERDRFYVLFFTDRALYRPGQPVNFKAIVFTANRDTNRYEPAGDRRITVALDDPNGDAVAKLVLRTNGFGSASGTLTVPANRLNGRYRLHTVGAENGDTYVNIEEYKRPKFAAELAAPAVAPRLGEKVTLTGSAMGYAGAPVDSARVRWNVVRRTRYAPWCWWMFADEEMWRPSATVATGETFTDAKGAFSVEFPATPDPKADAKSEPFYEYLVRAEITDTTGETRDAVRVVFAGNAVLAANVVADDWQTAGKPVALTVNTTSLDGVAQSATGTLTIYTLKQPEKTVRKRGTTGRLFGGATGSRTDISDPRNWEEDDGIHTEKFTTGTSGKFATSAALPAGIYRAVVTAQDRFGKIVTAKRDIAVTDPAAKKSDIREPFAVTVEKPTVRAGEEFCALWRTGYESGRALVSIEHRGKILKRYWTDAAATQERVSLPVGDELRGGFTFRVFQVRENRFYETSRTIDVPWDNKDLKLAWSRFNSKLVPGGRESWTLRISKPDGSPATAELAASLYDASLDAYLPHGWQELAGTFYRERHLSDFAMRFASTLDYGRAPVDSLPVKVTAVPAHGFRAWRRELAISGFRYDDAVHYSKPPVAGAAPAMVLGEMALGEMAKTRPRSIALDSNRTPSKTAGSAAGGSETTGSALAGIVARANLCETAFFHPALVTEPDGSVRIEFTAPEALTRWRLLAYAHDRELRGGLLDNASIVTSKDLMVQPNPPRFLRVGDAVEISVKITNRTNAPVSGHASLRLADALTLENADAALGNALPERAFELPANSSRSFAWRVKATDGQGFLTYKAVAAAGLLSDGEEGWLPVLPRERLVTESVALDVLSESAARAARPADAGDAPSDVIAPVAEFKFPALVENAAKVARNEALTVQVVPNPKWYVLLALPYLFEFPHECSEQLFSRFFANALASHIVAENPEIAGTFKRWLGTASIEPPLLRNESLKGILLSETPWVRETAGEAANLRNLARLFDKNRLATEQREVLQKLFARQSTAGGWPWFTGGEVSPYITRHIVAGFGRLRQLGVEVDATGVLRALPALDDWLAREFADIKRDAATKKIDYKGERYLTPLHAYHLYARSFFLNDFPLLKEHAEAYQFFLNQTGRYWVKNPRQTQAHLALALHRFSGGGAGGEKTGASSMQAVTQKAEGVTVVERSFAENYIGQILASLRGHARRDPNLGMYWEDKESGCDWWQAPVETQAVLIELFHELAKDDAATVEALQVWLVNQKRGQQWTTTKATADAVYALLLGGAKGEVAKAETSPVRLSLGNRTVEPRGAEAGSGYYRERIRGADISPAMGDIRVNRPASGVAWASVTWQYFQTLDKLPAAAGNGLRLKKSVWKKAHGENGEVLLPLPQNKIEVGDTLVVRLEIANERPLEFLHLKDDRPSGTEPLAVLSGYRWDKGIGRYETTKDTAAHFFIDYLRAGTHLLEYTLKVVHRGAYQSGIAELQSMYAPEFSARSTSQLLVVE